MKCKVCGNEDVSYMGGWNQHYDDIRRGTYTKRRYICMHCGAKFNETTFEPDPLTFSPNMVREPHDAVKATDALKNIMSKMYAEKEAPTMQVEYNGFTGELVKLEMKVFDKIKYTTVRIYDIAIYNHEKNVTISADGVKLSDIKFLGGAVSFCQ